ncbi:MAG: thrombospondin type 3 repeat-containing protein, partial [Acidobacteriota bacterium]
VDEDVDMDGVTDCNDNCVGTANADQVDTDMDGEGDACDACPLDAPDDDLDDDGTCNSDDECPEDPNKTEPGQCGCGNADTDTDMDGTADCVDECDDDPNKTAPGDCGCGNVDEDVDMDGVTDCNDNCVGTANADQVDTDMDGEGDACDACPLDAPDDDLDDDGTCNSDDECPEDPNKTEPGQCGCGNADTDTDMDGTADCNDNCVSTANADQLDTDMDGVGDACDACPLDAPNDDLDGDGTCNSDDDCPTDPDKTEPGQCGCGTADTDSDGDGVSDCNDQCPDDGSKLEPGQCGCGSPDTDSDMDGTADCVDPCSVDPDKVDPGVCGCGVADVSLDGDSVLDCLDNCPTIANEDQADADGDLLGDACDACGLDPDNDFDNDEVCGDVDNCPETFNPSQVDADEDGLGDACSNPRPIITRLQGDAEVVTGNGLNIEIDATDPGGSPGAELASGLGIVSVVEYFIDEVGETPDGTVIIGEPLANVSLELLLSLPVDISLGQHVLFVRVIDDEGRPSLFLELSFVVTEAGGVPIILVPGWDPVWTPGDDGDRSAQVATWASRLDAAGCTTEVVDGHRAFASPRDNALALAETIDRVKSETGSTVVDILAFDYGAYGVLDHLTRDRAERLRTEAPSCVRNVVLVASPLQGWEFVDGLFLGLQRAAVVEREAGIEGPATQRLAEDRALRAISNGAAAFRSTIVDPGELDGVSFFLLAGERPATDDDDLLLSSSALVLGEGDNVVARVFTPDDEDRSSQDESRPTLHYELLERADFYNQLLAPIFKSDGESVLLSTTASRPFYGRPAVRTVRLLETEPVGGKFASTVVSNGNESVTVTQYSLAADVEVTVTSPSGKFFDVSSAEGDSNVTYQSGGNSSLSYAEFVLTDPEDGDWVFEITSAGGALSFGKISTVGALSADMELSADTVVQGGLITATLSIAPEDATVSTVVASFIAPDGTQTDVGMTPLGGNRFSGQVVTPVGEGSRGRWSVSAVGSGSYQGQQFALEGTESFDVTAGEVQATGFGDSTEDVDMDGTVDLLNVAVTLQVNEPGSYVISGKLADPGGQSAGTSSVSLDDVGAGSQEVTLSFAAESVSAQGVSGKFGVSSLSLTSVGGDPTVVSFETDVYETSDIDLSGFEANTRPSLRFLTPDGDTGLQDETLVITWVDSDPDSSALINLFLDDDDEGFDGQPIVAAINLSEDDETDRFELDLSTFDLVEGQEYYIHGSIEDADDASRVYAPASFRFGRDTDGDGLLDSYELANGLDAGRFDSESDADRDGLANVFESQIGTDPSDADSDVGGEDDGRERRFGRDPLLAGDDVFLPFGSVLGDVAPRGNPDGAVNITDVVGLLRMAVGLDEATPTEVVIGDVSPNILVETGTPDLRYRLGDTRVNIADVVSVLRVAVGLDQIVERR